MRGKAVKTEEQAGEAKMKMESMAITLRQMM
jgi:hypothetical protein